MNESRPERTGRQAFTGLFAFALFALFLILSMLLVTIGVRVYKSVVEISEADASLRSALGYVAGKLRAGDEAGAISLFTENGTNTLLLTSYEDGEAYETRIYFMDGALYELYAAKDSFIGREYGEKLVALNYFTVTKAGPGAYLLSATETGGRTLSMTVATRADAEVGS